MGKIHLHSGGLSLDRLLPPLPPPKNIIGSRRDDPPQPRTEGLFTFQISQGLEGGNEGFLNSILGFLRALKEGISDAIGPHRMEFDQFPECLPIPLLGPADEINFPLGRPSMGGRILSGAHARGIIWPRKGRRKETRGEFNIFSSECSRRKFYSLRGF